MLWCALASRAIWPTNRSFPALYAMVKHGVLNVPVVGVASSQWSLAQLRERAKESIEQSGGIDDHDAFDRLLSLLRYVDGDYRDPAHVHRR